MDKKLKADVRKVLQGLVRIPSVNPREGKPGGIFGEKRVAGYVARTLRARGIPARLEEAAPGRPNVFARIKPPGRPRRRILLDAHLDTVEVEGMKIPPFSGTLKGGRIYGRGSCDCKAPLAAMICALGGLDRKKIKSEISFCAVVGEEHDMLGARFLMKKRRNFDWAVVGEPGKLNITIAHKGALRWELTTFGLAAHGARPELGINAIYKMSDFIRLLNKKIIPGKGPRHPLLGGPVFNLGKISGGSAYNIVPDRCTILLERRYLPGEKTGEIIRELRGFLDGLKKKDPEFRYQLKFTHSYPAMEISPREELVLALKETIKKFHRGVVLEGKMGATDAGVYSKCGIPSVVFGPGDDGVGHSANEYVKLDEVVKAARILKEFLESH